MQIFLYVGTLWIVAAAMFLLIRDIEKRRYKGMTLAEIEQEKDSRER